MTQSKTALITGASGGIGYELTKLFAKNCYHLGLVARNEQRLKEIAEDLRKEYGISVRVIVKDLAHAGAPKEIFDALQRESIHVDVLVNNAGYTVFGEFS